MTARWRAIAQPALSWETYLGRWGVAEKGQHPPLTVVNSAFSSLLRILELPLGITSTANPEGARFVR